MTTPTWEERDLAIHQLFMSRLQRLMDDADVSQGELARRMGGGVTQSNISRWLSCRGTKMTPGRFGTAVRALGEDPAKQFAAVVSEARDAGLMDPGTVHARKKEARGRADSGNPIPRPRWDRDAWPTPEDFGFVSEDQVEWETLQGYLDQPEIREKFIADRRTGETDLESAENRLLELLECRAQWQRAHRAQAPAEWTHPSVLSALEEAELFGGGDDLASRRRGGGVSDEDAMMGEHLAAQARDVQREFEEQEDSI